MQEEYWLKCGFKENGELTCVRMLSNNQPSEKFYYTEKGDCKEVKNSLVIKLTEDVLQSLKAFSTKDNGKDKK